MTTDSLYGELGLDYPPHVSTAILRELAEVERSYKAPLSDRKPSGRAQRESQKLVGELGNADVRFGEWPVIHPIRKKNFTDYKLTVPSHIDDLYKRFDYFRLQIPIVLMPQHGWAFVGLECKIRIIGGITPAEQPTAYDIFPEERWKISFGVNSGLNLGVNANLEFGAGTGKQTIEAGGLRATAQAEVGFNAAAALGLVLPEQTYDIRRQLTYSKGRKTGMVEWRLEDAHEVQGEEPGLAVILQVPKAVARVDIHAGMRAHRDPKRLLARLGHLKDYLFDRSRRYLETGAPVERAWPWEDITAGLS